MGSSPLARGLPGRPRLARSQGGIIPARAGFTSVIRAPLLGPRDHPRSRGVYVIDVRNVLAELGSSPLARGLHRGRVDGGEDTGIIPARAGFTPGICAVGVSGQDHPRSRGVYCRTTINSTIANGSSPLARGLRPRRRVRWAVTSDHPRSRGVYTCPLRTSGSGGGSSPLARGLRDTG